MELDDVKRVGELRLEVELIPFQRADRNAPMFFIERFHELLMAYDFVVCCSSDCRRADALAMLQLYFLYQYSFTPSWARGGVSWTLGSIPPLLDGEVHVSRREVVTVTAPLWERYINARKLRRIPVFIACRTCCGIPGDQLPGVEAPDRCCHLSVRSLGLPLERAKSGISWDWSGTSDRPPPSF